MGMHGDYLIHDAAGDPFEKVPELSPPRPRHPRLGGPARAGPRRGGRPGRPVLPTTPAAFADGIAAIEGAQVLNDVVFTQVCAAFGDDERTRAVVAAMLADGTAWMTGRAGTARRCCGYR